MKINTSKVIENIDGSSFMMEGKPLTFAAAVSGVLLQIHPGDNPTPEQKFKRFQIAQKCYVEAEPDLTIEELAEIKAVVGKFCWPLIVGRVFDILERKDEYRCVSGAERFDGKTAPNAN